MNSSRYLLLALVLVVVLSVAVFGFSGCNKSSGPAGQTAGGLAKATVYTCPMHPEITSDKPGQCPKCHMDLVKKGS